TGDALRESKKFSQPPEYHAKTSGNLSADPLKKPYGFLPWNLSGILRYLFRMFFRRDCFHLSPALLLCITLQFLSRNAFLRFIIRFRSFFFQGFFFRNHFFCGFFLRSFYVLSLFCLCGRSFAFLLFFPWPVSSAEPVQRNSQHSDSAFRLSVPIDALQYKQPEQPGNFPADRQFFQTIFLFVDLSVIADRNKQKRTKDQKQQEKENQQYNSYYFQYQQQNMYHL